MLHLPAKVQGVNKLAVYRALGVALLVFALPCTAQETKASKSMDMVEVVKALNSPTAEPSGDAKSEKPGMSLEMSVPEATVPDVKVPDVKVPDVMTEGEPKTSQPPEVTTVIDQIGDASSGKSQLGGRHQLLKLTLSLLAVIVALYVTFMMLRKTSLFQHLGENPIRIKSVTGLGGKSKLALVEVHGSQILVGLTDHSVTLIKEFGAVSSVTLAPVQAPKAQQAAQVPIDQEPEFVVEPGGV